MTDTASVVSFSEAEPVEMGWSTPEREVSFLRQALHSAAMGNDIIARQFAGSSGGILEWAARQAVSNKSHILWALARSQADLEGVPEGIDIIKRKEPTQ